MNLKIYAVALPILFVLDMLWLGVVSKSFYAKEIGALMKADINWPAGILFYFLFAVGLVVFVIAPSIEKASWIHALALGALFGCIAYATFDLTNLALLKDWPLSITIVDILWGTVLSATTSVFAYFIATRYFL